MNGLNSEGAAIAASPVGDLRAPHGRKSLAASERRKGELLAAHLAGGGTINAFARIHRMTTRAVGALRATLPPTGPIARTGGRPMGYIAPATWLKMDALADLMTDGCPTVKEAGQRLGMPQQTASKIWGLIRRELGSQAV